MASLADLATETLQHIADELDDISKGALIFTNKRINNAIGTQSWADLRNSTDKGRYEALNIDGTLVVSGAFVRWTFVKLIARDLSNWTACESCEKLHPMDLIQSRVQRCKSSGEKPVKVGLLHLSDYYEIYPMAVNMVYNRLVKHQYGADSSCAGLFHELHGAGRLNLAPSLNIRTRNCWRERSKLVVWKASWDIGCPREEQEKVLETIAKHKFYICPHMIFQDAETEADMMDVNNYLFNRLIAGYGVEPLGCTICGTKFEAGYARSGRLTLSVEKHFGRPRYNKPHWSLPAPAPKPKAKATSKLGLLKLLLAWFGIRTAAH